MPSFTIGRSSAAFVTRKIYPSLRFRLRSVPPVSFKTVNNGTSVEIYHGALGRFEPRAPVRTFVQFPISELKPGSQIKGKTVAKLGNRNHPLDMIVYAVSITFRTAPYAGLAPAPASPLGLGN